MNIKLFQTRSTLNRTVRVALFSIVALLTFCTQSVWADGNNYYWKNSSATWFDSNSWSPNNNPNNTSTSSNYYAGEAATVELAVRTDNTGTFPKQHTFYLGYNFDGTYSTYRAGIGFKATTVTITNLQLGNALLNQAFGGSTTLKGAMTVNGTVTINSCDIDRSTDVNSSIAGTGTILIESPYKNSAIKISGTSNAFTGNIIINENSLLQLTGENATHKASSITINSGATLQIDQKMKLAENSVTGSGTFKIAKTQSNDSDTTFLKCVADSFTGKLSLTGSSEVYYAKNLPTACSVDIEDGSRLRFFFAHNAELNCPITLRGYGGYALGQSSIFNHGSNNVSVNGEINVASKTSFGAYGSGDTTINGTINTNGNTLEFRQTRTGGSGVTANVSDFTITGNVTSGSTLGTIQFAHDVSADVATTHLYIGNSTASEIATIQTINANVINKNKNEIVFQPGENRTVIVNGTLKNESNGGGQGKGFIKNGAGTLELTADSSSTLSSKTTINAGTVKLSSNGNLGTGEIALNGGTLEFAHDTDKSFTNKISGTGTISKTGAGILNLAPTTEKPISATVFNVDAGTLKFSGKFTGNLQFNDEGILSMDDSASSLTVDGTTQFNDNSTMEIVLGEPRQVNGEFQFNDNSTLLFEQNDMEMSQLVLDTGSKLSFADDSVISIAMDSPVMGEQYTLITSTDAFTGEQTKAEYWNALLSPGTDYYWNLSVSGNQVFAQIDPNAVPEPSTWALLILGMAGLMWYRRRK